MPAPFDKGLHLRDNDWTKILDLDRVGMEDEDIAWKIGAEKIGPHIR